MWRLPPALVPALPGRDPRIHAAAAEVPTGALPEQGRGVRCRRLRRNGAVVRSATRVRVRQALGTAGDTLVIMMVGRLVAEKGYPELFRAVRLYDESRAVARQIDLLGPG